MASLTMTRRLLLKSKDVTKRILHSFMNLGKLTRRNWIVFGNQELGAWTKRTDQLLRSGVIVKVRLIRELSSN
jgi:hypothetical protein